MMMMVGGKECCCVDDGLVYFLVRFGAKRKDTIVPKRGGCGEKQIFFLGEATLH